MSRMIFVNLPVKNLNRLVYGFSGTTSLAGISEGAIPFAAARPDSVGRSPPRHIRKHYLRCTHRFGLDIISGCQS